MRALEGRERWKQALGRTGGLQSWLAEQAEGKQGFKTGRPDMGAKGTKGGGDVRKHCTHVKLGS